MTLQTTAPWFYSVMASLIFGAGIYESVVVHPAWSREPPESLAGFAGSRMDPKAFWAPMIALYGLSAIGALALDVLAGRRDGRLILSVVCAVSSLAWTLVYFRPNVHRFLEDTGGDTPAERLRFETRRWVQLNWIRMALVAISWWGALTTLAGRA